MTSSYLDPQGCVITGVANTSLIAGTNIGSFTDTNYGAVVANYLPAMAGGNIVVYWGDGSSSTLVSSNMSTVVNSSKDVLFYLATSNDVTHTYAEPGTYNVSINVVGIVGGVSTTAIISSTAVISPAVYALTIIPQGTTFTGVEATVLPMGQIIGSFTDSNTASTSSSYVPGNGSIVVNWGDGHSNTLTTENITVVNNPLNNLVYLKVGCSGAAHAYAEAGTYNVLITISVTVDAETTTAVISSTAIITDAGLTKYNLLLSPTPVNVQYSGNVGAFVDSNPSAAVSNFVANIDWADGSPMCIGSVSLSDGIFYVNGYHTYKTPATYTIKTLVTDLEGAEVLLTDLLTITPIYTASNIEPQGVIFRALEGIPICTQQIIGSFTDTNTSRTASGYTMCGSSIIVNWGDCFSSTFLCDNLTITANDNVNNLVELYTTESINHTYCKPGTYNVEITVSSHTNGGTSGTTTALISSTAVVADNLLTEMQLPVPPTTPNAGQLFCDPIAAFVDANPYATPCDFESFIDWGDGSPISIGTIILMEDDDEIFVIFSHHIYENPGEYCTKVTLNSRYGESKLLFTYPIIVNPSINSSTIVPQGYTITGIEQNSTGNVLIGSFTDSNLNASGINYDASGASVQVNWGDGSSPQVLSNGNISIINNTGTNSLVKLTDNHVYHNPGTYGVEITVTSNFNDVLTTALISSTAVISDAPLSVNSLTPTNPILNVPYSAQFVSFNDSNPVSNTSNFSALIDWNDGTSTNIGTITQPGGVGTPFYVSGNHTYRVAGNYNPTVLVTDLNGGSEIILNTSFSISIIANSIGPLDIETFNMVGTRGNTFRYTASFIDESNANASPSSFSASINWGDGSAISTATVTKPIPNISQYLVNGSHIYTSTGNYNVTLTVNGIVSVSTVRIRR